jgi:restriction system protein
MARRSGSVFEDIADITSKFPWWAGVSCALVSFFFLHWYAGKTLPAVTGTGALLDNAVPGMLRSLAFMGQFVVPVAFLLGSFVSAMHKYRRTRLYDKTSRSAVPHPLNDMSWRDFEFLVGEYFRRRQFTIAETKTGADGGIDLIAGKGSEKYLVQCKQWRTHKVGVQTVRELLIVMVGAEATGGIVVTSSEFTKEAVAFARANKILLLDGRELHNNMKSNIHDEHQRKKKTGRKPLSVKWVFAGLLVIAGGSLLLHSDKTGTTFYSMWSTRIKALLPAGQAERGKKIRQIAQPITQKEAGRQNGEKKYSYEIEFVSGGRVYTDNVIITDKIISYTTDKGLVVSLSKNEVQTLKKTTAVQRDIGALQEAQKLGSR